jgi:hypothetical protein
MARVLIIIDHGHTAPAPQRFDQARYDRALAIMECEVTARLYAREDPNDQDNEDRWELQFEIKQMKFD